MEARQSENSGFSQRSYEYRNACNVKRLFCNDLKLHNYIEANYLTAQLPWDNIEFIKIVLRQMCKRIGVTCLTYTNSNTAHTNILQINESKQQQQIKNSQADKIRDFYKIKYSNLWRNMKKNSDRIRQKASREILDKLTTSHEEHLKSQEETYEEMISQITSTHEAKVKSILKFYEDQLRDSHKSETDLRALCNQLSKQNEKLTNSTNTYENKLMNIENLLLGRPPILTTQTNNSTVFDIKPEYNTQLEDRDKEISELKTELLNLQAKLAQFAEKYKNIEDKHKVEIKQKDNYIEKLMMQIRYHQDLVAENEKKRKEKELELSDLQKHLDCSVVRHNEQFKHYEKLVKKGQAEIDVHKREINRLREHISSVNFNASPAIRPKQILESTSSPKKTPRQTPKMTPQLCEEDSTKFDPQKVEPETASNNLDSVKTKSVAQCLDEVKEKKRWMKLCFSDPGETSSPAMAQEMIDQVSHFSRTGEQNPPRKRGRPRKNPIAE